MSKILLEHQGSDPELELRRPESLIGNLREVRPQEGDDRGY